MRWEDEYEWCVAKNLKNLLEGSRGLFEGTILALIFLETEKHKLVEESTL